ncbi:MAG: Rpn family recombination-promoting nuclease/putative transposase [Saprospiraceae bacterium]|nr:Rpn family recombination-promoting nuclease/putative transposase [Saprospiraceae bacterium]
MKFVDVKNDIAFRKIFGNEQKSAPLISFLNAALELEGNRRVVSVTLANPNLFPRIAGEKASILDVRATDQAGRKFVVEMQVAEKDGFDKRVQYYLSRDYSMQINKGEDYPLLNPAYFIGILDFEFSKNGLYHTRHLILDKTTNEHLLKDIEFSFVELPKFKLGLDDLESPIDKWAYFIKHAVELNFIPEYANEDEGFKIAFVEADKHNWSKDELIAYDNASIAEQDERGKLVFAEKKGKIDVAREMKKEGEPIDKIIRYTGLTEDEINEI